MATLILDSNRTSQMPGCQTIGIIFDGRDGPIPAERVTIRTAADAAAALDAYAEKAKATGQPVHVSARLERGERAPAGFRKLEESRRLRRFVNV